MLYENIIQHYHDIRNKYPREEKFMKFNFCVDKPKKNQKCSEEL